MEPIDQLELPGTRRLVFGEQQADDYTPLPGLVFPDGRILTEWSLSSEERAAIARGENVRLLIWKHPASPLQPVRLEVTNERH